MKSPIKMVGAPLALAEVKRLKPRALAQRAKEEVAAGTAAGHQMKLHAFNAGQALYLLQQNCDHGELKSLLMEMGFKTKKGAYADRTIYRYISFFTGSYIAALLAAGRITKEEAHDNAEPTAEQIADPELTKQAFELAMHSRRPFTGLLAEYRLIRDQDADDEEKKLLAKENRQVGIAKAAGLLPEYQEEFDFDDISGALNKSLSVGQVPSHRITVDQLTTLENKLVQSLEAVRKKKAELTHTIDLETQSK